MKWFLAAIGLLLVGIIFQLGLLVYAMYVLLGVILVNRFLSRTWINHLEATRECNRISAQIGETAAVAVVVRNTGSLPIPWLIVEDSLSREALHQTPKRIKVTGPRVKVAQLPPKAERTLLYQVEFLQRGYYQLGPLLLESGDVFGLHRRFKVATDPHYVLVFPQVIPIPTYDITSRRPMGEMRLLQRLFEDPTRISGVREYQHGDPMSRVHWGATARTGSLHCKTFDASCIAGATLLVDFHLDDHPLPERSYTSELAISMAASLANAVYQLGQQVGLIANGRDAAERVREEGHRQEFVTRNMARTKLEETASSTRLRPVQVQTRRGAEQIIRILETLARQE